MKLLVALTLLFIYCEPGSPAVLTSLIAGAKVTAKVTKQALDGAKEGYEFFQIFRNIFGKKEDQFAKVFEQLGEISLKLDNLQVLIDSKFTEVLTAIGLNDISQYKARITAAINRYVRTLASTSNATIVGDMNDIIRRDDDIDHVLMDYLSRSPQIGNSPLKNFVDMIRNTVASDDRTTWQFSVSSFTYQFQHSVLLAAMEYASMIEQATILRDTFEGRTTNTRIFDLRKDDLMKKFRISLDSSSRMMLTHRTMFESPSYSTFLNLNKNDVSSVRLVNSFQTYFLNEYELKMSKTCAGGCEDVREINFNDGRCNGKLNHCIGHISTAVLFSKDPDRIYSAYCDLVKPYTSYGAIQRHDDVRLDIKQYRRSHKVCSVCKCTCHTNAGSKPVSYIYSGIMQAPADSAVTGVRFASFESIIYLDIQYGKLISMGMVDPATQKWLGRPHDIRTNKFIVDFKTNKFPLENSNFGDGRILTGVQFERFGYDEFIRLKIYGAHIVKNPNLIDSLDFRRTIISITTYPRPNIFQSQSVKGRKLRIQNINNPLLVTRSGAIEFNTSEEKQDAGQSTIPFFDSSDIVQDLPLVLTGIGFIHYTNKDYGGYLRPFLRTADMKHYV